MVEDLSETTEEIIEEVEAVDTDPADLGQETPLPPNVSTVMSLDT